MRGLTRELRDDLVRVWRHGALWAVVWIVTRAYMFSQWSAHARFIWNDVRYYYAWMSQPDLGMNRLVEYPVPVLWVLGLIVLPAREVNDYVVLFGLTMAALDAVFTIALHRRGSTRAVMFWTVFVLAFGGLIWFRYDMVPALVVGLAALYVTRHPRVSGALVALGAGLKLWPALLIAPLAGRHRAGVQRVVWFAFTGLALALLALISSSPARLVSPLTWQGDRGLQIEAVPATWLMAQRVTSSQWKVEFSPHNAFEIYGPGVEAWLRAADLAMAVVVICAVGMGLMALLHRSLPADVLTLMMVAVVAGMLVANKTFSPQYLVWLAAPVAALLVEARTRLMYLLAAAVAVTCIVLAWLTQQVYPVQYAGLIGNPHSSSAATSVLVARNLLMVAVWVATQVSAVVVLLRRVGRR
ncbi:glycosyltransferase 87 family protein [Aestuariimicrobium kwangyangense]|uniref:glycosyltransferase 87 family protein n=1 Tax=Aestuariimicrobium kwangyangense TaxID=396389 RepID=UPI0003B67187|nr:glycosyltransferase 87 family protein [Aestuariimicrobium kwangyangense]